MGHAVSTGIRNAGKESLEHATLDKQIVKLESLVGHNRREPHSLVEEALVGELGLGKHAQQLRQQLWHVPNA